MKTYAYWIWKTWFKFLDSDGNIISLVFINLLMLVMFAAIGLGLSGKEYSWFNGAALIWTIFIFFMLPYWAIQEAREREAAIQMGLAAEKTHEPLKIFEPGERYVVDASHKFHAGKAGILEFIGGPNLDVAVLCLERHPRGFNQKHFIAVDKQDLIREN